MVPMSDEAMCEAWERLMATSVPAEKRDAIRAGFYAEPSAQARYATLLEFSSYLRQDEQTRARAHAVRRGQRGANPANGNDAAEETRDSLERLIQRQTDTEPSLAWLLGRVRARLAGASVHGPRSSAQSVPDANRWTSPFAGGPHRHRRSEFGRLCDAAVRVALARATSRPRRLFRARRAHAGTERAQTQNEATRRGLTPCHPGAHLFARTPGPFAVTTWG